MPVAVLNMEPITLWCLLLAGSDPAHTSTNRLEIANQGNARFPQMKTEKKKHRILPVRTVSNSVWDLGRDPRATGLRALRKTGRNSPEMAKSKVFYLSCRVVSTTSPLPLTPQPGQRETSSFSRGTGTFLFKN